MAVLLACCTRPGAPKGARAAAGTPRSSASAAALAKRIFLEPARPYPWRYGEAPPGLLARRRALMPGEKVEWRFVLGPGGRVNSPTHLAIRFTLWDGSGHQRADLGAASVVIRDGAVDGGFSFTLPASLPNGTYLMSARFSDESGEADVRAQPILVNAAYSLLRRNAEEALARASSARLDKVGRQVSLPSLQMLVEDADIVWNDFVDLGRDWKFVESQLLTAAAWAARLGAGDDPFRHATGTLVKAYRSDVDDTLQPYGIRIPRSYTSERAWPLVIDLHGAYANHRFDLRRVFGKSNRPGESDHEATRNDLPLPEIDMIVATAYGRGEMAGYAGIGERDVLDVMTAVGQSYRIDPNRVYLTGYSMGGEGTWQIGLHHPDRFAAIVPVCAISDPMRVADQEGAPRGDYDRPLLGLGSASTIAENALNQRVIIYHGAADPTVPVGDSRAMVDRYRQLGWLGRNVEYRELPGVDHAAWVPAYRDAGLFALLAPIVRDPFPRRVIYRTISSRYREAYWLRIDRIEHGLAVAELTGDQDGRTFVVAATNVTGFSLRLPPAFVPAGRRIVVRLGTAEVYDGAAQPTLSFLRTGDGWTRADASAAGPEIPDHAQPGLFSKSLARTRAHLYVYGSAGSREVTDATKRLAEQLAFWGEGVKVRFEVKRDDQVSDADIARFDLVLVGAARSNRLVARMAGALPIVDGIDALAAGGVRLTAPDRAYRLMVPNPLARDRYVLILGGNTEAGLAHLRRFAAPNATHKAPESNQDYTLIDGDGRVRLAGVFRGDWRIGH